MKKLVLSIAALALVATTMTSCKKEYTCECTVLGISGSETYAKMKKADAEDKCNKSNTAASALGGSCKLK